MAAVAPPASALLQVLIQDTATEEDLRRVDEHPEVLLDALAHWVDVQLAACLDAASDSATGEVGPRQVAAVPVRRIEPVAAPRPQLPAASDFPPLSAAAAPQKTKQRRRLAPTPVAVAPAVQLGDAASSSAAEPFKAPAEQLAPPTPGHAAAACTPTPSRQPSELALPASRLEARLSGDSPAPHAHGEARGLVPSAERGAGLEGRLSGGPAGGGGGGSGGGCGATGCCVTLLKP